VQRRALVAVVGEDLSLCAVVRAMVRGEEQWRAVASFCEEVMRSKEEAERDRRMMPPPAGTRGEAVAARRTRRGRRRLPGPLAPPRDVT